MSASDSKQVIMYDEKTNEVKFAQVSDDTFVLSQAEDGSWRSMTYAEWETLRCEQACEAAKTRAAEELPEDAREKVCAFLDSFMDAMRVKYLEGKRSWGQIYDELVDDFKALS